MKIEKRNMKRCASLWILIVVSIAVVQITSQVKAYYPENDDTEFEIWSGTGFALNKGYIVTNSHVIAGATSIVIQDIKEGAKLFYEAVVVKTDKKSDLAILKITDSKFTGFGNIPYSFSFSTFDAGEDIFVLGYPLLPTMGDEIKLTTGVISSKTGFQGDVSLYQISAPIQPGNSGGPLFDKKGQVIGIVNSKHVDAENVGYAIKSIYLRNLIESSNLASVVPINNTISNLPIVEKVKLAKKFVFTIYCSSDNKITDNIPKSYDAPSNRIITNPGYSTAKGSEDLHIHSVILTPTETILDCSCKKQVIGGGVNISSSAYIEVKGIRNKLSKTEGIALAPDYTYFSQALRFKLYFPAIPKNAETLDFIESPSGWKIFNMSLK